MFDLVYAVFACMFFLVIAWLLYHLPILAAGVRSLRGSRKRCEVSLEKKKSPFFSIVVPVKSEQKVIGRLLDALSRLDYRADGKEVIIVEDGSSDESLEICREYALKSGLNLKILHKSFSDGKPSALNYGLKQAKGDIIAVFDADSVPSPDTLLKTRKYFDDPEVAAVQGRTLSINSEQNMLTKFLSYEETAWCEAFLRGKDVLGLFVHLKGSCQFVRRDVLEQLNGFDENVLAEDVDLGEAYRSRLQDKIRF